MINSQIKQTTDGNRS